MRTYSADQIARGVTFAWAYHRKLRAYLRRPHPFGAFGRSGPQPTDPNFVHHVLAAELADELGVPYDAYIEAHFWFEHTRRGRHPQVRHLHQRRGITAAERVSAWQRRQAERKEGRVLAEGSVATASRRQRCEHQERTLRELCDRWSATPEEILRAFGGPDAGVFDAGWLRDQALWREIEATGHFERQPGIDLAELERLRAQRGRQGAARP